MQNLQKKTEKNPLNTIWIVYFLKPACLQKDFHGWLLFIRVFFSVDGYYGLILERLSLTLRGLTSNGKRQRWPLNLCSFLLILASLNHIKIEKCIRHKYKYFHSTVQRPKDRRQKFHFCRLPFDVRARNVKLNLSSVFSLLEQIFVLRTSNFRGAQPVVRRQKHSFF